MLFSLHKSDVVPSALGSKLKTSKEIRRGAGKEVLSSKKLKADLHSANFSHANDKFRNGECFLFNLHLKRKKFGLILKPHLLLVLGQLPRREIAPNPNTNPNPNPNQNPNPNRGAIFFGRKCPDTILFT